MKLRLPSSGCETLCVLNTRPALHHSEMVKVEPSMDADQAAR